jgi:hypothetical protein
MAYTTGDTILDDHYNGFATSVNAIWGTGSGDAGYGQTSTVSAVSTSTTVTATQWTTLLSRISSAASHQTSSITSITNPSAGNTISAFTALSTNIATITSNRLNVHARQSVAETAATTTTNLTGTLVQEGKWVFGSANQARYFFNAGGRVSVRWDLSGFTANNKANEWNALMAAAGTYYVYAQSSGKSGGSGTISTNLTNYGYYDMSGSYVEVFKQYFDSSSYTAYGVNYMKLEMYQNGAEVYWKTTFADDAADTVYNKSLYTDAENVDGTKQSFMGNEKPNTSYISDTWGTVTQTILANG